jgi:microcystin-dependent protein
MSNPFIGEIRLFAGNFEPQGWAFCNGQLLPISENDALFNLIGTTYGGDGQTTFALPDLRGRVPVHQGTGFILGQAAGVEEVTLTVSQTPAHSHPVIASTNNATTANAQTNVLAQTPSYTPYISGFTPNTALNAASVDPNGGSQPHTNFQPYLCVDFIISLFGVFPPQSWEERGVSDPFVAEIRIFPFNFAPKGWAFCDGQLLPISQNTALFSLLGTTYGGDGKSNFALPDLQGRAPMHPGQGPGLSLHDLGETGGTDTVTLLNAEMPAHQHGLLATGQPGEDAAPSPTEALGRSVGANLYQTSSANLVQLAPAALSTTGGSQPHNNLQPYLTLNFNIALQGVYPSRP